MRSAFRTPKHRPFRSAMYSILGLSIFILAIHGVLIHGWALQNERMSLTYFMGFGILNGTATAIYIARIPERWYHRRFNIYGSSHQIMHVLVVCGAFSDTIGLVKAFDYWQGLRAMEGGACARI
jgi:adiponectin receptor